MQLLVDTHALLWFQSSNPKLSVKALNLIGDSTNKCFVSIASLWEMAIKVSNKKLIIIDGYDQFFTNLLSHGFEVLDVRFEYLKQLQTLPHHHNDPFDRLLIAQAITEDLTIISADRQFDTYPVNVSW